MKTAAAMPVVDDSSMRRALQDKLWFGCLPEPNSGCWLWLGRLNAKGYGTIFANGGHVLAHRLSFQVFKGSVPTKKCVLHMCDVRCCVNPEHLYLGTQFENMNDMESRGRGNHPSRESHGLAKLTVATVQAIRASSETHAALGRRFGVTKENISAIRRRLTWIDV